ncbi:hypothetical protein HBI56_021150 [Parastagonospora nodorum]|uniref:Uncharacterized protein n=1 Tax=Phaeosphaeria nodorum (strain SN15 / ATCC MYA-4574 / FGSC 10173) TaxID=321614 RepID=A0A7U2F4I4_PHANO|nr:hypothetical protein HBH56_174120 [Parastagonospora nodorum]QRC96379.1 hypothetical protein JI435_408870 [Parastagonospora nodorum SN15]KAH3926387.1 hypothetical protein HBH54_169010 [Parastagonospora nodorum]KAH3955690.1 hypothetical protein HBH53_001830 [Parastagonospora nodorum]KAH3971230.1 hypothetical protein HBH51_111380 [Parastagonospora nodorum]
MELFALRPRESRSRSISNARRTRWTKCCLAIKHTEDSVSVKLAMVSLDCATSRLSLRS